MSSDNTFVQNNQALIRSMFQTMLSMPTRSGESDAASWGSWGEVGTTFQGLLTAAFEQELAATSGQTSLLSTSTPSFESLTTPSPTSFTNPASALAAYTGASSAHQSTGAFFPATTASTYAPLTPSTTGLCVGAERPIGQPVDAAIRAIPGTADPAQYAAVLDQFSVETNPRYAQNQRGVGDTWCNMYVWDATRAMGVEIPYWTDANGNPTQAGQGQWMDANRMSTWLDEQGSRYGWQPVTEQEAQGMANLGYPVVAAWNNPGAVGHVGMVRPGAYSEAEGPLIAQAGVTNSSAIRMEDSFYTGWKAGQVRFYVNVPTPALPTLPTT